MFLEIKDYNRINSNLAIMKQNSSYWYTQIKTPANLGISANRKRISTGFKVGTIDDFLSAVTFGKNF